MLLTHPLHRQEEFSRRSRRSRLLDTLAAISLLGALTFSGFSAERSRRQSAELVAAFERRDFDRMAHLIEQGATRWSTPEVRAKLLRRFAARGDPHTVRALLMQGVRPDERATKNWTPLMAAACYGEVEVMQLLLDWGSDPQLQDANGQDALMCAVMSRELRAVELLLQHGANPNRPDHTGLTSAALAKKCRFPEIVSRLEATLKPER